VVEPNFSVLSNPCRVTLAQRSCIVFSEKQRYIPIVPKLGGIVMLRDTKPDQQQEIVATKQPKLTVPGVDANEPQPPAPFQYNP